LGIESGSVVECTEGWEGVQLDPLLITRSNSRPQNRLGLVLPLCQYEMRGKKIVVPRKHPNWTIAPLWIEFRPVHGKAYPGAALTDTYRAWAFPSRMPPLCRKQLCCPASSADITGVTGTSFYTTDTSRLSGSTLLAWLDGVITTWEAANYGSKQLKQIGVVYPSDASARIE